MNYLCIYRNQTKPMTFHLLLKTTNEFKGLKHAPSRVSDKKGRCLQSILGIFHFSTSSSGHSDWFPFTPDFQLSPPSEDKPNSRRLRFSHSLSLTNTDTDLWNKQTYTKKSGGAIKLCELVFTSFEIWHGIVKMTLGLNSPLFSWWGAAAVVSVDSNNDQCSWRKMWTMTGNNFP